ncbi:MAG: hypothetical protein EAZ32_07055 [Cytophagia bacterium]|nr:MAG: hypothetical protein EAZ46_07660 [Runella sp.]TAG17320.1 MAG: hypothetical protein EAZ38_17570 [Cytophagales bacterium]TAG40243.1 MAG: hypothetical protein EAZ32_07055 [Cytophagia bacterium]TAG53868.1 MAG: hypothetical protein EAZ29_05190 [Runella slithyformis]TAG82660.1 MAG: hypothetical protein EAZ22_04705 [Cytophagales bacterium]
MKQITLTIPDREYSFFMRLLKSFNFVEVKETKTVEEFTPPSGQLEQTEGLKSALNEVELHQQGKTKLQMAKALLAEMREEERVK